MIGQAKGGDDEAVLYVVGEEAPDAAMKVIGKTVAIGSKMEIVGRVSHQLLAALKIELGQIIRI